MDEPVEFQKNTPSSHLYTWDENVRSARIKCCENPGHQRSGNRLGLLAVRGKKPVEGEVHWTWNADIVVSGSTKRILEEADVSGVIFWPTLIWVEESGHGKQDSKTIVNDFWEMRVIGYGGVLPEKSGVSLHTRCSACGYLEYSVPQKIELDVSEYYDKLSLDFCFFWPFPLRRFVSKKAQKVLQDNNIGGWRTRRAFSDVASANGVVCPGRLSYYLPYSLAKQLGTEEGIV